jgi:hypothetical protein
LGNGNKKRSAEADPIPVAQLDLNLIALETLSTLGYFEYFVSESCVTLWIPKSTEIKYEIEQKDIRFT